MSNKPIYEHSMDDRTPYVYLIGWSKYNKWYYGVRFAKGCHPTDLWKTYFTSSKHVKKMRNDVGEPDIIQVRKSDFIDVNHAREYEDTVIRRMNAVLDSNWLNRCYSKAIHPDDASILKGKTYEEIYGKEKADFLKLSRSISNKRRKLSETTKKKISESQTGKIRSEDAKNATSVTLNLMYSDPIKKLEICVKKGKGLITRIDMCPMCGNFYKNHRPMKKYCSKTCSSNGFYTYERHNIPFPFSSDIESLLQNSKIFQTEF